MKRYHITSINIQQSNYNYVSGANGVNSGFNVPSNNDITLDVTFIIPDPDLLDFKGDIIRDFERFISVSPYSWCSDKMLEEALKDKYPERFL